MTLVQREFFTGKELGLRGQQTVLDKEVQAWVRLATETALRLATETQSFTIEDVYEKVGRPPRHFNSAGALLGNMARHGAPIMWTGEVRRARTPSRHGALIRVWTYRPTGL